MPCPAARPPPAVPPPDPPSLRCTVLITMTNRDRTPSASAVAGVRRGRPGDQARGRCSDRRCAGLGAGVSRRQGQAAELAIRWPRNLSQRRGLDERVGGVGMGQRLGRGAGARHGQRVHDRVALKDLCLGHALSAPRRRQAPAGQPSTRAPLSLNNNDSIMIDQPLPLAPRHPTASRTRVSACRYFCHRSRGNKPKASRGCALEDGPPALRASLLGVPQMGDFLFWGVFL